MGWAALHRWQDGFLWAAVGGLSVDALSAGVFGSSMAALGAAALVGAAIGARVRSTHPMLAVVAVPFGAIAYYLVALLFCLEQAGLGKALNLAVDAAGPAILLDCLIGVPVMVLMVWLSRAIAAPGWQGA